MAGTDPVASERLFDRPPAHKGRDWFALRIRSRQEKALSRDLTSMGIEHFLPLVRRIRFYGGRRAKVQEPLFPGYLFIRGGIEVAYEAERTRRIVQIIEVADQLRLHNELKNIAFAISRDATLAMYPFLKKGVRVEVRAGPLRGLAGLVLDRNQRDRLILNVDTLGTAVSVEIDPSLVDLLE